MTMHKALHPRIDLDRLYVIKIADEDSPASIRWLKDYIKKQQKKHNDYQNNNYYKTKMERENNIWLFRATNKWNLIQEDLDMTAKP